MSILMEDEFMGKSFHSETGLILSNAHVTTGDNYVQGPFTVSVVP